MCCTAVIAQMKSRIRRISQCYLQLLGTSSKPLRGPSLYCWGSRSASVSNHRSSFTKQGCNPVAVKQVWNAHPWQRSLWGCSVCTVCCKEHTHPQRSRALASGITVPAGPLGDCCQLFRQAGSGRWLECRSSNTCNSKSSGNEWCNEATGLPAGREALVVPPAWVGGKNTWQADATPPAFSRSAPCCWFQQQAELGPLARI